jgi:hypothetical protein
MRKLKNLTNKFATSRVAVMPEIQNERQKLNINDIFINNNSSNLKIKNKFNNKYIDN